MYDFNDFQSFIQATRLYKYSLMAEPINVVALLRINTDKIQILEPYVKNLAEKSRAEEGVARYEVYRVNEKEGVYLFLEQYKNQEAREFHRSTEHFKQAMAACGPYFLQEPVVVSLQKEPI